MELDVFVRLHARPGQEASVEAALRDVVPASRQEPGCLSINAFRSTRNTSLFYIHSRWASDEAFEIHAGLPHTVRFLERVDPLLDPPREIIRTRLLY
jgi:quinol monooxygenase YgiN